MPTITYTHPTHGLVADDYGGPCGAVVSRFTFQRTAGPSLGLKDVGIYYPLSYPGRTIAATAFTLGLGIGGFMEPTPARKFFVKWKPLARSTPAPVVLGGKTRYIYTIKQLFFSGRNIEENELFLMELPEKIGGYQGTVRHYRQNGTTLFKTWADCYIEDFKSDYDGSQNFVEYELKFSTITEPT